MCESVPVAQSAGEDQGRLWPEKTEGRENKHWKHGHGQNPAGLGLSCPVGTSGTALTPPLRSSNGA